MCLLYGLDLEICSIVVGRIEDEVGGSRYARIRAVGGD